MTEEKEVRISKNPSPPVSIASRIAGLDGLRGGAILLVLMFHAYPEQISGGFIGVDIFFVLSGYLITSLLVQEFDRTGGIRLTDFYVRRFMRLAPALLLLLATFCSVSIMLMDGAKVSTNLRDAVAALGNITNWSRAFGSQERESMLGHTWSLSIEGQFYVFWPIVLVALLLGTRHRATVAAIAGLLAIASWGQRIDLAATGSSIERLYNGTDSHSDGLMLGAMLGLMMSGQAVTALRHGRLVAWLAPLAWFYLAAFAVFGHLRELETYYWGSFIANLVTMVVILDILFNPDSLLSRLATRPWLVWIGSISYGIYLWHLPIFKLMAIYHYHPRLILSIGSALSVLIALASSKYLEKPILRWASKSRSAAPIASS